MPPGYVRVILRKDTPRGIQVKYVTVEVAAKELVKRAIELVKKSYERKGWRILRHRYLLHFDGRPDFKVTDGWEVVPRW